MIVFITVLYCDYPACLLKTGTNITCTLFRLRTIMLVSYTMVPSFIFWYYRRFIEHREPMVPLVGAREYIYSCGTQQDRRGLLELLPFVLICAAH